MDNITMLLCSVLALFLVCASVRAQGNDCDDLNCYSTNGAVCNDVGICDCGQCKCDGYYTGLTCEECPTCPSSCQVFRGCVGCKMFGTGPMGVMECLHQCHFATLMPVSTEEFDSNLHDDKPLCQFFNDEYCMESFRVGGMTDGYRDVYVRVEMDCNAPIPTTTPKYEVIDIGTVEPVQVYTGSDHDMGSDNGEVGTAEGSDKDTSESDKSDPKQQPGGGYSNQKEQADAVAGSDGSRKSSSVVNRSQSSFVILSSVLALICMLL